MMLGIQRKNRNIAWYKGSIIDLFTFEYHVVQASFKLFKSNTEQCEYAQVINLCSDNYHFLVAFTACMLNQQTTTMPANKSESELSRLVMSDNNTFIINDIDIESLCEAEMKNVAHGLVWETNLIPDKMIVARLYTSGSTGEPVAHDKSWRQLVHGAQQVSERFSLEQKIQTNIVATVPPQHMYGFEMCIILPLVCHVVIHHNQPFYPLDIQIAIDDMVSPSVLVTTPTHLKACISLQGGWGEIDKVISATSPLSKDVAVKIESAMNTVIEEIYGCSEVGAIATRRLILNHNWALLPNYTLYSDNSGTWLQASYLSKPLLLPDKLEILLDREFRLIGRITDMVKIGGKRGSLLEITANIKMLSGVKDAIVFKPEQNEGQRDRLAALVVAPDMTVEQIRLELLKKVDQVFLPRPLCFVAALPYTSTGKLPLSNLMSTLDNYLKEGALC